MTRLHYKIAGTHPLYLSIKALRYKILISTKEVPQRQPLFFGNILKTSPVIVHRGVDFSFYKLWGFTKCVG